jgi:CRP-like cAMP-binding protein
MEKFITTLNSYGLLSNEEITALQNLLSKSKKLTLKKGQFLWQYDDMPQVEVFVNEGLLRQFTVEKNGNEKIIQLYQDQDFIHDCSGKPIEYAIQAIEDCNLLCTRNEDSEMLFTQFSVFEKSGRKMTEALMLKHKAHINLLLISNPEARYKQLQKTNPELIKRLSVTHLAQYLSLSRETISRIRGKVVEHSIL